MIPAPRGLSYLPYQLEGIEFAKDREACLFGDEMGLGKTIQAIGWMNCHPEIESCLIVCPATLRINWTRELDKWLISPYVDIKIVSYDSMGKADLERTRDVAILDEAHYIKNKASLRSRYAGRIQAKRKLALTGTPLLNRPIELWNILHWLSPETWPASSYWKYALRYCGAFQRVINKGGKRVWDVSGASHLDELSGHLSGLMIRRTKAEVLKDLPAKRRQIIEIPLNGIKEDLRMRLVAARITAKDIEGHYAHDVRKLESALSAAWTEMAGLRHEAGLAKVGMAVDVIKDAIESEGKVVVFGHHRDVLAGLYQGLSDYNPVVLHGGTTEKSRMAAVDAFQNDPKIKVFIGQIQAAGVGITLTAASQVIFVELDWTPGVMSQAEDRCHRIGQKDSVLVQHLALAGSLDSHIAKALVKKQDIIDMTLRRKN